ncbi:hypothetical protein EV121DRAFT_297805 [Schizophyllum commune]
MTDHVHIRLKRRAAVLIDARAFPVRAPSTTSRNDAGTHSFPPTTMVPYALLRRDAKPRSSSDAIAVVPRMRPTRDSQAWETGGSPPSLIPDIATRGIFANLKPPEARAGFLGEISEEGGGFHISEFPVGPNRQRHARGPSAKGAAGVLPTPNCRRRARAPSAKDAEGVGYPYRRAGLDGGAAAPSATDSTPGRQRHARAPSAKDAAGVGYPYLLARGHGEFLLTQNRRRPARAPSVKDARGVGYPLPLTPLFCEPRRAAGQLPSSKGALCSSRDEGKSDRDGFACRYTRRRRCTPTKGACRDENSAIQSFRAVMLPVKRLETDIFDAKDPSPSSLPTSSRSTPVNASICVPRDVADR